MSVSPERLATWLSRFDERHGVVATVPTAEGVRVEAGDSATAECELPFGWFRQGSGDIAGAPSRDGLAADDLVATACQEVRFGVLLARRAALAVGVAEGHRLVASKVETSYVQGRTAAGGWSQHRFARRRDNQARDAARGAADVVARVLLPELSTLVAVRTGGDKRAVTAILTDPRLVVLADQVRGPMLDVPEPRRAVLEQAVRLAREVRIRVVDPTYGDLASPRE